MRSSYFTHLLRSVWVAGAMAISLNAPAVVTVVINFTDSLGEGFFDPTLGPARQSAFFYAVNQWASQLVGTVPIQIEASFDGLGGTPTSAILGQAFFTSAHANFVGAPLPNTWYPVALANQLAGTDNTPVQPDIVAIFNSDVDDPIVLGSVNFYYGTDGNPGPHVDFVTVALHELGHGLGFASLLDLNTGQWAAGLPDIYSIQLTQQGVGDFSGMTDGQRATAVISGQVYWKGANVVAEKGGQVKMYAPNPVEPGSSISHWDPSNSPDLLMEPAYSGAHHSVDLTKQAFQDLGWSFVPPAQVAGWELY